jgi:hypothetical protein
MRLFAALAILIGLTSFAFASEGFDLVIPGRPGVPIIVNGLDVSYAVIEGDFGLGKGVHNQPTVFGGRLVDPEPNVGHYYPSLGLRPGYGRVEIEPPANRKLPQPAESFHQSWGAQSAPLPPTIAPEVPMYPPPVILAPRDNDERRYDFSAPPQNFRRGP